MRERTEADDIVQGAYNRALLDLILPSMRRAAMDCGYAITVHGSLNRDIDLVAIPWREHGIRTPDALLNDMKGAVCGVTGRCNVTGDWAEKPHGRRARSLLAWCGESTAQLDISVMPHIGAGDEES